MAEREKIDIDGTSFKVRLDDGSGRSVIVFVHGIFGDAEETWGDTIATIMGSPQFASFDYASFGYGSNVIDLRKPDRAVDLLVPWIDANLRQYGNIYLVAHSMGGLAVRHAITRLLNTQRELVPRLRGCFLLASPVTGSPVAKGLSKVGLGALNRRVTYLAYPTIDGKDLSQAYKEAADAYILAGGSKANVPRFYYFIADVDRFVFEPQKSFYTEYDAYVGRFPGGHSFIREGVDQNSTLVATIRNKISELESRHPAIQIEKIQVVVEANLKRGLAEVAREAPRRFQARAERLAANARVPPKVGGRQRSPINVLLISCSANKTDNGQVEHPRRGGIGSELTDPRIQDLVMDTRGKILRAVQSGFVDGVEFKQGNRIAVRQNRELLFGPDFGGEINERRYLPAYSRYTGRCFRADAADWEALYQSVDHPSVLIMSGLYGLIPAYEYIQNYDVHLTDVDSNRQNSLQTQWRDREVMTQILASHLEWIEANRGPIGVVVDALSELSYQETINWSMVDAQWPLLHRVFNNAEGRDTLADLGMWIRGVIRDPSILNSLAADQFYDNVDFSPGRRIAFEEKIGGAALDVGSRL
jgi:pimeloyl-ACP methyl ester carboxylesterase